MKFYFYLDSEEKTLAEQITTSACSALGRDRGWQEGMADSSL
jgi:hypothetical protein